MDAWRVLGALIIAIGPAVLILPQAHAVDPDTFSPVVSYQYLDTLAEPGTPITSPVVSYQYYDWPGDENLTFAHSPSVSFYFHGAPQILTQPAGKAVRVGQTTGFSVAVEGSAPLSYQWRKNGLNLPNTDAASIQIANAQLGHTGSYSVVVQNAHGAITSGEAYLLVYAAPSTPAPALPGLIPATETPSPQQLNKPGVPPSSAQLISLGTPALINPYRMTIVLTHGWYATAFDWPASMANALKTRYDVNIVAWDWHENALLNPLDPAPSAARTVAEGTALGRALMDTLGPDYDHPIHFLGHSLGTIVNCAAADYIHGHKRPRGDSRSAAEYYPAVRTHMTLFDEAELVTAVKGVHVALDVLLASTGMVPGLALSDASQQVRNFWSKVIPDDFGWVDNYLGEVGLLHPKAANVMLWAETNLRNPIAAHGYAYYWYELTILNPLGSSMGHRWSYERQSLGWTSSLDRYYVQRQPELLLDSVGAATAFALQTSRIVGYPNLLAVRGLSGAGKATHTAVNAITTGTIKFAGNLVANIAETFTEPSGNPVYLGTSGSTPAFYVDAATGASNLEASWDLEFGIQSGAPAPAQLKIPFRAQAVAPAAAAAPNAVYAIIPVRVPKEAVGISFEFQITGGAVGDFMTMGIGEENSYTVEAEFLTDGEWNGTPVIRVSDDAGQDTQLVFALNGADTPPTGTLRIRNIQFYLPPPPEVTLSLSASELTVSWPLSAFDWTLETSPDLSLPNGWQPESGLPEDTDYFHTMTFDISMMPKGFFRLSK